MSLHRIRFGVSAALVGILGGSLTGAPAGADEGEYNYVASAETVDAAVRVTLVKAGSSFVVQAVRGSTAATRGCTWTVLFAPDLADAPYGTSAGPQPTPDARFALLLCDGAIVRPIWVAPSDVLDVDAVVRSEAERYVREVLTPAVSIGVNPTSAGLAGLQSWFWIDGFSGSVTAPPITAFGLTVEVRMSSSTATWHFGDGAVERGDLGRAYPEQSTVRHAYRSAGSFAVSAELDLVPEYRVAGGPWLTLPSLTATAGTTHQVQQRQPVVTDA